MAEFVEITFSLNGSQVAPTIPAATLLIDFLRETCGLRGTKRSCDMEVCGACTVLVDNRPVSSCTMLAADVDGAEVTTVEGLARDGELHPIQRAFVEHDALQCGFCTPGFLLAAKALLDNVKHPTRSQIVRALDGNICRCTGYKKIIEAIEDVASS